MRKSVAEPVIEFKDYGFIYHCKDFTRLFVWNRITKIVAYKDDLVTTDDIRLQICDNNGNITLTEDYSLFAEFNKQLLSAYPEIDKNWYGKILHTPFAANTTVIYKKAVLA